MLKKQGRTARSLLTISSTIALWCLLYGAPALSQDATAPGIDPIARQHGGLRGAVIGPYSARYHYPDAGSTVKLKDGSLLHIFNRRERLPEQKNSHTHYDPTVIVKVSSRDGGQTWSAMEELFRSGTGHTASNPSLVRLANGELGASYNRIDAVDLTKPGGRFWTESVKRANRVFRYSSDEGRTWSPEIVMTPLDGYWTGAHDRFLVLASGRVLHPLHHIYSYEPYKIGVRVAYSDDHGRSWRLNAEDLSVEGSLPGYVNKHRQAIFAEANVVERQDGTILLLGRTITGRQYYATSKDKGVTWSQPYPSPIVSPEAPARMVRVPSSNDLLLIWTSCCIDPQSSVLGERLTLSTAISTDGGASWQGRRELVSVAPGLMHGADYPSVYFDGDKALVAYTSGAKIAGQDQYQHYLAVLPLAWFYAERDKQQAGTNKLELDHGAVAYNMGGLRGSVVGPASAKHPYQSEGTTIRLKDGSIMHAFNLRAQPEAGQKWHAHYVPTQIAYALTKDKGRTWSSPQVLLNSPTRTASHPALVRLPNGDLGITYNRIAGEMEATKVFRSSKDEGKTWSDETLISPAQGYWTSAHDRLVAHSSGRLIQPLHNKEILKPEKMVTRVAWSDDNGKTWQMGKQALVVPITVPEFKANHGQSRGDGFWEVSIAERADKSLYMIGRTRTGYLYESISTNKGETWAEPKRTQLVSNEAPAFVARVPGTNDLLLVWNSCCIDPKHWGLGLRLTLSAVISSDGGKTWGYRREVASVAPQGPGGSNDDGVAYPSIYIDDGLVYLGYFARMRGAYQGGGGGGGPQLVATLPLSWFYAERDHHRPEVLKSGETKQQ